MKINTTSRLSSNFQHGLQATGKRVVDTIASHPVRAVTDVADLSIGGSLSLGVNFGPGEKFMQGAGLVLGVAQMTAGAMELIAAIDYDIGANDNNECKCKLVQALGDGLAGVGNLAAACGVGPTALGFIGVGMLISSLATQYNKATNNSYRFYL